MIKAWDSDGHVSESEVTFSDKYWDPKLKDRRPTIIETGPDGPLYWMIDTRSFPVRSGPFQQAGFPLSKNGKPAKVTPGISPHDPVESAEMRSVKSRLEQLDRENTAVQVIYPTMFLSYPITYDRDLAVAMMRAYNSWIADLTSQAPDRLKWATLVDPVDPRASVDEIKRTKKMGSVAVMLLGVTGDIRIDDPPMEPIWAAANEVGLPVAVHTGHSFRALGNVNDTHHDKTAISFWLTVQFAFQRVISKGIADRYPNLRIAFLEAGCSWVPSLVERITDYSGFPGARAGEDFRRGYNAKHLPKEYIARGQIYFGFEVDEKLLPFAIEEFGNECWLYGSDIPHGDRLYGAVDVFLQRKDISEESKRKLFVDNNARFYGLEVSDQLE
ncbi:MAG TPA: amidohydrolase family protein [Candidatus Binatia bacterium]